MKAIFGLMALVIVLAVVANLAKKNGVGVLGGSGVAARQAEAEAEREAARQAGATAEARGGRLDRMPGAVAADPSTAAPQAAQGMQQRALERTNQALQQGMQRNERAAP
jgi:hypothetical protein